jgi:hypothetical protein
MRLVFFQIIIDTLQVCGGYWRPPDTHQELSIRSMRASISSSSMNSSRSACAMPFSHGGAKTSVLFKQAQGGILHQPLGIRTGMTGDLG